MDALENSFKRFSVTRDRKTFSEELDEIVSSMGTVKIEVENSSFEWQRLQENLSKLKYIDRILMDSVDTEFMKSLESFMGIIDTTTQHYLREVNFDDTLNNPFVNEYGKTARELLEKSLNTGELMIKIKYTIQALNLLVDLVENVSELRYVEIIDDTEFIDTFVKRRRLN